MDGLKDVKNKEEDRGILEKALMHWNVPQQRFFSKANIKWYLG